MSAAGFGEGAEGGQFGVGAGIPDAAALFGAQLGELAADVGLRCPGDVVVEIDVVVGGDLDCCHLASEALDEEAVEVDVGGEGEKGRGIRHWALGIRLRGGGVIPAGCNPAPLVLVEAVVGGSTDVAWRHWWNGVDVTVGVVVAVEGCAGHV
ncbi:MAG: hypothetical protein ACF8R7_15365 [Phycisphaerales bacterium JB039]